jgi:hypothetical protein
VDYGTILIYRSLTPLDLMPLPTTPTLEAQIAAIAFETQCNQTYPSTETGFKTSADLLNSAKIVRNIIRASYQSNLQQLDDATRFTSHHGSAREPSSGLMIWPASQSEPFPTHLEAVEGRINLLNSHFDLYTKFYHCFRNTTLYATEPDSFSEFVQETEPTLSQWHEKTSQLSMERINIMYPADKSNPSPDKTSHVALGPSSGGQGILYEAPSKLPQSLFTHSPSTRPFAPAHRRNLSDDTKRQLAYADNENRAAARQRSKSPRPPTPCEELLDYERSRSATTQQGESVAAKREDSPTDKVLFRRPR